MITFLSSSKSFSGLVGDNQLRAISSWLSVHPSSEVILFGRTKGIEKVSHLPRTKVVPDIESTPTGVPYFDAIATYAQKHATHDIQVYLNSDILMSKSLLKVVDKIHLDRFLLIGQRIDLVEGIVFNINQEKYLDSLEQLVGEGKASLKDTSAMDYFVFSRGMWRDLKPLVIGRAGYDSALIAYCLRRRIPVIDTSLEIIALHQNHDYRHISGGIKEVSSGKEAEDNKRLHGVKHSAPNTSDAFWIMKDSRVIPNYLRRDAVRRIEITCRYVWNVGPAWMPIRLIWRILSGSRLYRPSQINIKQILDSQSKIQ